MKKPLLAAAFTSILLLTIAFDSFTNGGGASGRYSGAPNENDCTSCHFGAKVNSGKHFNDLTLSGDFQGNGYVPDSTYNITIKYKQKNKKRIGFETTVLDSKNAPIGNLAITSGKTRKVSSIVNGQTRQYITHSSSGTSVSGDSIEWTFEWKAPSSNVGNVDFYIALNVTNADNGDKGDSVYTKKISVGSSGLLPEATASSDDKVFCAGTDIQMKGTGTNNPTAYKWTFPDGSPSTSIVQNPKVTYTKTDTQMAVLRVQNKLGWSDPDTFRFKVNPVTAFIQGAFPATICPGDSVKIQAAVRTGYKFEWNTKETTDHIYAKKAGLYQVAVTTPEGCSKISSPVQVKEYTVPTPTISSDATRDSSCSGNRVTFTGPTGYDSVILYRNAERVAVSTTEKVQYTMDSSASFTIRVRTSNGCLSDPSSPLYITVNQRLGAPVVSCADKTSSSLTFSWKDTTAGHASGYQVSIDGGNTWKSPNNTNQGHILSNLLPETKYELRVRAVEQFPCFYSTVGTKVCTTGVCNTIDVSAEYDTLVCAGTDSKVTLRGLKGKKFSVSFEGGPYFSDTVFTYQPTFSTTYTLKVVDSAALGCPPEPVELTVKVQSIGQVTLRTEDGKVNYCTGDTVKLTATEGNEEYRFYVNNKLRLTTQDSFYYESEFNDRDSVFVIATKGVCVDSSDKLHMVIYPVPDATFTYSNDWKLYTFTPNVSFHSEYHWDFGDGDTSEDMMPSHDYGASEGKTVNASLSVVDNSGCYGDHSEDIVLPEFSSVADLKVAGIEVYPNPVSDFITVEFTKGNTGGAVLDLVDLNGKLIRRMETKESKASIKVDDLAGGIYMLQIKADGITNQVKIQVK